ncbi:Spy0128 family protein [Bifidobacterium indicum]|uniref:Spy0128 family protein n=3 Tax=Bifidobacterium TaxID=1678 RepID=UPI0030DB85AA
MLDQDVAAVSALELTSRKTGTAPFDDNDDRGNDSGPDNDIVRSFDSVTYGYDFTVTPDSRTDYYRQARIGFRFELPYAANIATFNTDAMGWMDQTPGYQPTLSTDTVNGVETQVLTAYRLMTATSMSQTVVPGTGSISLAVKVKAAPNNTRIAPKAISWVAFDATTRNRVIARTVPEVRVSAKLSLNVRVTQGSMQNSLDSVFNFDESGAENAPNYGLGKRQGVMTRFNWAVDLRWKDRTKGLRGLEAPSGPITFSFTAKNVYNTINDGHQQQPNADLQPYLWDYGPVAWKAKTAHESRSPGKQDWFPSRENADYAMSEEGVLGKDRVYNNGTYLLSESRSSQGTVISVTLKDYQVSDAFPFLALSHSDDYSGCSAAFMSAGCSQLEVGEISTNYLYLFNPTTDSHGRSVNEIYNQEISLESTLSDGGLQATSVTGDRLANPRDKDDTSNQAVTKADGENNDDERHTSVDLGPRGDLKNRIAYNCASNLAEYQNGMDCAGWMGEDDDHGTDMGARGSRTGLSASIAFSVNSRKSLPALGMSLVKIDPDYIDLPNSGDDIAMPWKGDGYWTDWATNSVEGQGPKITVLYAAKKDGTKWASKQEQKSADIDDLVYYPSKADAENAGKTVVAILLRSHTAAPSNKAGHQSLYVFGVIPARIKSDARMNGVAQMTSTIHAYNRQQLAAVSGLDPDRSTDAEWESWANGLSEQQLDGLWKTNNPVYHNNPNANTAGYRTATYDKDGYMVSDPTPGKYYGDSLYIVGEFPKVGKSIVQHSASGKPKSVYDLDSEQRTADWQLGLSVHSQFEGKGNSGPQHRKVSIVVDDTLPKGLNYLAGSSILGGTYQERTPRQGHVTGGETIEPTVTVNSDGTTKLRWRIHSDQVFLDGPDVPLYYSTSIGDSFDASKDVVSGASLNNQVRIFSENNKNSATANNGMKANLSISVYRSHSAALAVRADPVINDVETDLGFNSMISNPMQDVRIENFALGIMPYNGADSESNFHGSYRLSKLTVVPSGSTDLSGSKIYVTTDTAIRGMDTTRLKRDDIASLPGMIELPVGPGGEVAIPANLGTPTAWAFTGSTLPVGGRFDFRFTISPQGNQAGDVYCVSWHDGHNTVIAFSQVVNRRVSGVAWFDLNGDGSRTDEDRLLANVHVDMVDSTGTVLKDMSGRHMRTTTDADGRYSFTNVPSGSGFHLRFTPADGTTWEKLRVTRKQAPGIDASKNSDSDAVLDGPDGSLSAADIALADFPLASQMRTVVYEDANEDHGLTGDLRIADSGAGFTVGKELQGRDWRGSDSFVVDVTPLNGAPASAFPARITLTAGSKEQRLASSASAFPMKPGITTYRYQLAEHAGSADKMTYDTHTYTVEVSVDDNFTALVRNVGIRLISDNGGEINGDNHVVFRNVFTPDPVSVSLGARKVLHGRDLRAGEFSFTLTDKASGSVVDTVSNGADGSVSFKSLEFGSAGTRRYEIAEVAGSDGHVAYDSARVEAVVEVSADRASGGLSSRVVYGTADHAAPVFTNTFTPDKARVSLGARKVLHGRDLRAGEFSFTLTDKASGSVVDTVSNGADGSVSFKSLEFGSAGTRRYEIAERNTKAEGISYDGRVHDVTVTVSLDSSTGMLTPQVDYDGMGANPPTFVNRFTAGPHSSDSGDQHGVPPAGRGGHLSSTGAGAVVAFLAVAAMLVLTGTTLALVSRRR